MVRLEIPQLDLVDLEYLSQARESDPGGVDPVVLADLVVKGAVQIWRVQSPTSRGIFVTQLNKKRDGLEVMVWLMAGKNITKNYTGIFKCLEQFGKAMGARWISGIANPTLAKLYRKKLGFKPVGIYSMKEID